VFQAMSDTGLVWCLHIGQGFGAIRGAPDAPIDNLIILACQISALAAQDVLWGPAMRTYPDLKFAFSEGGIGWIPFYLDRCDRHYTNQRWLRRDFGGKLPSEVFREHTLACYVTDPTTLKLRNEIGIDNIAWECDYPHSDSIWPTAPEFVLNELNGAGATDPEIDKITWQNASRFFNWDPFAVIPKEKATVGACAPPRRTSRRLPSPGPSGLAATPRSTASRPDRRRLTGLGWGGSGSAGAALVTGPGRRPRPCGPTAGGGTPGRRRPGCGAPVSGRCSRRRRRVRPRRRSRATPACRRPVRASA
jgi:hypothetical protein